MTSMERPILPLKNVVVEISQTVKQDEHLNAKHLPGLADLIDDWYNEDVDVDEEQFFRRFLRVFKASETDDHYSLELDKYSSEERELLNDFVDERKSAADIARALETHPGLRFRKTFGPFNNTAAHPNNHAELTTGLDALPAASFASLAPDNFLTQELSAEKFPLPKSEKNLQFQNWGRTVSNIPELTFTPKTDIEVQNIVKYAKAHNKGVRVSGFRHSWSPVFGRDQRKGEKNNGDILISTLDLRNATVLPNFTSLPGEIFEPKGTELNVISVVEADFVSGTPLSDGKKYVRVGTSTTNEQLRRWCKGVGKVTLPMNIIEVEITLGGSNAPICHGAGIHNKTISDQVRRIDYVDANGELRKVDMAEPDLLKAASGCFGLLGVVTHITLEFDAMSAAVMKPRLVPVVEGVPPPPDMDDKDIPAPLRPSKPRTLAERRKIQEDFEQRAMNDYYAEWFWFPYSSKVWVNTWSTDSSLENVVDYPSKVRTTFQVFGTIAMNILQNVDMQLKTTGSLAYQKTALLSWVAMKSLDNVKDDQPIRTYLPDALHFQRGVQNIRVRDLEVELPLHPKKDQPTKPEFINVQRAWWDAILKCYEHIDTCPQRMPLEMRVMAGSNVTMAPQRGNTLGTAAIEILTLHAAADKWEPYAQQVLDKWTSYRDADGKRVDVRPHWAKEWWNYTVDGRPWREKLRNDTYKEAIGEFRGLLERIAERDGLTLWDLKGRFSNEMLDYFFLGDVRTPTTAEETEKPVHTSSLHHAQEKVNAVAVAVELGVEKGMEDLAARLKAI